MGNYGKYHRDCQEKLDEAHKLEVRFSNWMERRGQHVIERCDRSIAPEFEDRAAHSDNGDVWAWRKRDGRRLLYEVKGRYEPHFSDGATWSAERGWPYGHFIVDSWQRWQDCKDIIWRYVVFNRGWTDFCWIDPMEMQVGGCIYSKDYPNRDRPDLGMQPMACIAKCDVEIWRIDEWRTRTALPNQG